MDRQLGTGLKLYETPVKAIRKKCLDCTCGQMKEIRLCPVVSCACYPYRMGTRPDEATLLSLKEYYDENDEPEGELLAKKGTVVVEV
jgi:hypothetical protein